MRFGSRLRVALRDSTERYFRIVGEDEADPAAGAISSVAPVAAVMIGSRVGESVQTGAGEGEILEISQVARGVPSGKS